MNRTWLALIALAISSVGMPAMAASSPAIQCAKVVEGVFLGLIASVDRAALSICSGKGTVDELGQRIADRFNDKIFPKASAQLHKAGTCDPDLGVTAGSLDLTIDVADVTALMQVGFTSQFVFGVQHCNGVDDP